MKKKEIVYPTATLKNFFTNATETTSSAHCCDYSNAARKNAKLKPKDNKQHQQQQRNKESELKRIC